MKLLFLLISIMIASYQPKPANVWKKKRPGLNKVDSTLISRKDTCYTLTNNGREYKSL